MPPSYPMTSVAVLFHREPVGWKIHRMSQRDVLEFILIVGGARSGKTAAVAIPTLMSWKERVFAIDIEGELYEKTKKARGEAQDWY